MGTNILQRRAIVPSIYFCRATSRRHEEQSAPWSSVSGGNQHPNTRSSFTCTCTFKILIWATYCSYSRCEPMSIQFNYPPPITERAWNHVRKQRLTCLTPLMDKMAQHSINWDFRRHEIYICLFSISISIEIWMKGSEMAIADGNGHIVEDGNHTVDGTYLSKFIVED